MQQPPKDILAALIEGHLLRQAAILPEDKAFALRLLDEALDAWNTRKARGAA